MLGKRKRVTLGSGGNFAGNVLASIVAAIIVSAFTIMLGTLAACLKGISDLRRGILWGAALGLLLPLVIFGCLWLYWRLKAKGKGWESGIYEYGPRIVLGERGFHTKQVGWTFKQMHEGYFEADVLGVTFVNCGKSDAKSLQVRFKCEGAGASLRRWLVARLDDSPKQGPDAEVIFGLTIDQSQEVNLLIKEPQSDDCFIFNNESWSYPRAQNPAWKLAPGKYKILVEVMGLHVLERFECIFQNQGRGTLLKVRTFRSVAVDF
jgi:hypothetical protein